MSTPVVKVVHKMTQEERLKEAVITEKKNIESLHTFYQQEEDRKKSRRAALLAKRAPMTSFIRYVSKTTFGDPTIPQPLIQEVTVDDVKSTKHDTTKRKKDAKSKALVTSSKTLDTVVSGTTGEKGAEDEANKESTPNIEVPLSASTVEMPVSVTDSPSVEDHHHQIPDAIDQDAVDIIGPISIDSAITAPSSNTVAGVPESPTHASRHSPPSHMVIDPATGNPYDTLSPVGMNFAHHDEHNFRRSTSVEQLEADYINFHVAEEPSGIVGVPMLPETSAGEAEIGLVKIESDGRHRIISNDISMQLNQAPPVDLRTKYPVTSVLGEESPTFPMSDMIISDVEEDDTKSTGISPHKPVLTDASAAITSGPDSVIIPANYSSSIMSNTSSHSQSPEDVTQCLEPNSQITSVSAESTLSVVASSSSVPTASTSIQSMKTEYDPTMSEPDILDTQPHVLDHPVSQDGETQENMALTRSDHLQIEKLEDTHSDLEPSSHVIEGPRTCRAITTISLMEFPENFQYSTPEIQKVLFGPQSLEIPVIPSSRSSNITKGGTATSSGPGRKKRVDKKSNDKTNTSKADNDSTETSKSQETGKKGKNASAKHSGTSRLTGSNTSLASLTSNPLFSRSFGMKVGSTGLSVSGTSVGPLGTGVIGSGGGGPGGLSAAAANAAAAAAAAVAANGGLIGGSAAARAKSAAALAALQQAPKCVITGKPCKFVDPKSGLPYSSMEAFQMIRQVINFEVPWNKDFGIFMGSIGKEMRHAKGVPPGFAGVDP